MSTREDLTDKIFGRITVIKVVGKSSSGNLIWECKCDCGKITNVRASSLKSGDTRSCGCLQRESATKHSMYGTRTYITWYSIKGRCNNPRIDSYPYYGLRGITYTPKWETFEGFYEDMGKRPEGKTIDRIDPDGNYTKDNCRWATAKEQRANQRSV